MKSLSLAISHHNMEENTALPHLDETGPVFVEYGTEDRRIFTLGDTVTC